MSVRADCYLLVLRSDILTRRSVILTPQTESTDLVSTRCAGDRVGCRCMLPSVCVVTQRENSSCMVLERRQASLQPTLYKTLTPVSAHPDFVPCLQGC